MKHIELDSPEAGQPADHVDQWFRAFFRAQVPQPWPAWQPPQQPGQTSPASRRFQFRSRLALAASVVLLVLGHWLLAGKFTAGPSRLPAGGLDIGSRPEVISPRTTDLQPMPDVEPMENP